MKNLLLISIVVFMTYIAFAQDKIDPPNAFNNAFITDTTLLRYKTTLFKDIDYFVRGWNWGRPGKSLDKAMDINFYHGIGFDTSYPSNMAATVQIPNLICRVFDDTLNANAYIYNPAINVDFSENFVPTENNTNGSIYGFLMKNTSVSSIDNHVFTLNKTNVTSPVIALDMYCSSAIWTNG